MDDKTDNKVDNKKESSYLTISITSSVLRVIGCFIMIILLFPLGILQWVCSVLHSFFKTTEDWLDGLNNLTESVLSFGIIKKYYDARGEIDRLERIIRNPVAYELHWELDEDSNVWHTDVVLAERFFIRKKEDGFSLYYGPALLDCGIYSVDEAKECAQAWIERFCRKTLKTEDRIIFGRKWHG